MNNNQSSELVLSLGTTSATQHLPLLKQGAEMPWARFLKWKVGIISASYNCCEVEMTNTSTQGQAQSKLSTNSSHHTKAIWNPHLDTSTASTNSWTPK